MGWCGREEVVVAQDYVGGMVMVYIPASGILKERWRETSRPLLIPQDFRGEERLYIFLSYLGMYICPTTKPSQFPRYPNQSRIQHFQTVRALMYPHASYPSNHCGKQQQECDG